MGGGEGWESDLRSTGRGGFAGSVPPLFFFGRVLDQHATSNGVENVKSI